MPKDDDVCQCGHEFIEHGVDLSCDGECHDEGTPCLCEEFTPV